MITSPGSVDTSPESYDYGGHTIDNIPEEDKDNEEKDILTKLVQFDQQYTEMLWQLHQTWNAESDADRENNYTQSKNSMRSLSNTANTIMRIPYGTEDNTYVDGLTEKTYGPCFRWNNDTGNDEQ